MEVTAEKRYEAIKVRHSTRKYKDQPLAHRLMEGLASVAANLNSGITGARVVLVAEKPDKVFKGIIGSYGKIAGAPVYAAFVGDLSEANVQEKTGYIGELFILDVTAAGLDTCWVGGFFNGEEVKRHIELGQTEKVLAVTPVGYGANNNNFTEKLMKSMVGSRKRKDMENLYMGPGAGGLRDEIKSILEAARLAPSAMNRQPWRFGVEPESITVSVDKERFEAGVSKRLDCGIAMAHIETAALYFGIKGEWHYMTSPQVARFVM